MQEYHVPYAVLYLLLIASNFKSILPINSNQRFFYINIKGVCLWHLIYAISLFACSYFRFQFLLEFLEYLRRWKESTDNRPGNFSQNARSRMFISWQTHEGYKITVHSAIEATKFLLHEGTEFVLTERFCQDPLEEYFGNQRKLGRRSDNPDIRSFGYNANTIRIQRTVSCQSGNTRGRKDKRRSWEQITDSKLPCRKKRKLN